MTKVFDKIAGGLADAIAYAEGDTTYGRVANVFPITTRKTACADVIESHRSNKTEK